MVSMKAVNPTKALADTMSCGLSPVTWPSEQQIFRMLNPLEQPVLAAEEAQKRFTERIKGHAEGQRILQQFNAIGDRLD